MKRLPAESDDSDSSIIKRLVEAGVRERTAALARTCEGLKKEIAGRCEAERAAQARVQGLTAALGLLAAAPDRDAFVGATLKAVVNLMELSSGSFWLYSPPSKTSDLLTVTGHGPDSKRESLPGDATAKMDAPLPQGTFLVTDNASPDVRRIDSGEALVCTAASTLIRIPLFQDREYLGSFILHCAQPRRYSVEEKDLAGAIARQVVPVLRLSRRAFQDRIDAVLEERYRLACEIHDALAQHFAGILLQIGVAQRIARQQPTEAWDLVAQAGMLARTAAEEARRSVWALQPTAMEYSDLATTLTQTVAQMTEGTSVRGEVYLYGEPRLLSPDVGMNLLRIGQEALTNALRHATAQHIFVELTFAPSCVRLCIQDDGQGFDLQNQGEGGGFGLIGMRQRAERIGGNLTVSSEPGHGTEVALTLVTETTIEGGVAQCPSKAE